MGLAQGLCCLWMSCLPRKGLVFFYKRTVDWICFIFKWTRFRPPGSLPWCSGLPSRAMFSSPHSLAHQQSRFPSTASAGKGNRNAEHSGTCMFFWLKRGEKVLYHLNNALAQVNPLPNAARQTVSPSLISPFSHASQRAIGTDAAVVLPYCWILL